MTTPNNRNQNRLSHANSPYLLQHAENPVDWYPWGEEAFNKARLENKPIFLSIGYSTCHWCHVMAHESFEDPEVAQLMNETFISIKVDREERPDIDNVYMSVCQMMTGSGGWPLTIIMTPDKHPFFAATYIPKETKLGRIGLLDLIPRVKSFWSTKQVDVINSAHSITQSLQDAVSEVGGENLNESVLHASYNELLERFDERYGGFGNAPKFPAPHNLTFLLRYWKRTGNEKSWEMVDKTLSTMRLGGIYDHIGYGFHRYSTDPGWLVPHFEKMLYDQALLAIAYTEAYQARGREEYAQTAHEVFSYVLRDMTAPEGGFYSAEDADSDGEEGKFYLWTLDELKGILTPSESELAIKFFSVYEAGNYTDEFTGRPSGSNILHVTKSYREIASELNMSLICLQDQLQAIKLKLFNYRKRRVHPYKDDKILTDWNGLMIAALAKGARVLGKPEYIDSATGAINFILNNMHDNGQLLHRYRNGKAATMANLDDYAFLIYGLLELYESNFEVNFLKKAIEYTDDLIKRFWDNDNGGFYFTSDNSEGLIVRKKEIYDGALPSGNSISACNLIRLGHITANTDYEEKAIQIGRAFQAKVDQRPSAYTQLMVAVDAIVGPFYEVVIVGDKKAKDTKEIIDAIRGQYISNKIVILRSTEDIYTGIDDIAPYTKYHFMKDNKTTAYVCIDHSCKSPTTDVDTMLKILNSK
jgi:uncharacterized protein YyaL (SSP411 family)